MKKVDYEEDSPEFGSPVNRDAHHQEAFDPDTSYDRSAQAVEVGCDFVRTPKVFLLPR